VVRLQVFARAAAVGFLAQSCGATPDEEVDTRVEADPRVTAKHRVDAGTGEDSGTAFTGAENEPLSVDHASVVDCAAAAGLAQGACPVGETRLEPNSTTCAESGVYVQALQNPTFDESNRYSAEHINEYGVWMPPEVPPEDWDRSELPAGACVYRLFGLPYECVPAADELLVGTCPRTPRIPKPSITEFRFHHPALEPGCIRAEWAEEADGSWWYFRAGDGFTDVVICAPLCNAFYQVGACFAWQ
jgi:hypothetical protein